MRKCNIHQPFERKKEKKLMTLLNYYLYQLGLPGNILDEIR